jgi:uncharacterized membrane protein
MIWWSAIVAAIAGWGLSGFAEYGLVLGGILGTVFGWGARRAIRADVEDATAGLRARIDALTARLDEQAAEPARAGPVTRYAPAEAAAATALAPPPPAEPPRVADESPRLPPAEPGLAAAAVGGALAAARTWLLGGNTIVRIGLVILFVGLSFLASYAASAGLFPIELRLTLVVAAGMALLVTGFRTRVERPDFGLALQGGGVAVIYLTLFAAARLYDTVPLAAAFVLMIVVCALGCALALLQRSQALAVTAFAGGFAVPLLLSDGGGEVAGLFAYYTVLNAAILFIAWRRSWRVLNLTGVLATFGVLSLWMASGYGREDFAATQTFLLVSVLIYVATAVLYTRATPGRVGQAVDTTLLFGPALAGFGIEVALVGDRPFGSAFAALGFALLYLGVAAYTSRYRRESLRVMNEAMLAIGVGFVTLAIPLALGARWTSAAWALEGAGAFWVGTRQARWMPRLFGLLLQAVAALIYLGGVGAETAALPFANAAFVGAMLIAIAALFTGWLLRTPLPHSGSRPAQAYARVEAALGAPVFLAGFAFWWLAWAVEAARMLPPAERGSLPEPVFAAGTQALLFMLAYVVSAWGAQAIARRLRWPVAAWPASATLAALILGFLGEIAAGSHVLYLPDAPIWAVAIPLHLHALYRSGRDGPPSPPVLRMAHAGGVWLATAMLADALLLGIDRWDLWQASWAEASLLIALVAVLVTLTLWAGRALGEPAPQRGWPLNRHAVDYAWIAAVPVAALLVAGALLVAVFSSGSARPLPYVPLINPADLSVALALAATALWRRTIAVADPVPSGAAGLDTRGARAGLAGLAFVAVNTAWLRLAHHWLGVAWDADALLADSVVQTGLAILWTLVALALMIVAHRRARRTLWLAGAGLLGLTVVKLLLVDLNAAGGGARIVAFIGVGVLMLAVGYLAPLPPRTPPPPTRIEEDAP